ncbi:16S rRNA (adenine(1518)-N(6)/adenine(1519)-N(6))-dimethyltransferase RsmA [Candidatus Actinomarina]|nr:16S rRNA (adenine(1518)-N(6)/adenine(1519)-N(6))-dimethyltransferase RsmA [Candidatus Actinomarina sp.]|tara:strand:+ start:3234 stop:4025 length:792 start_codon:yes stop_codon:yes gene_type:complete
MSEAYWIKKMEDKPNFKLGQNFLLDTNISRKITKLVQGQLADPIVEIGPGTGSLTNELLKDNYRIKAIEIDKNLAAITEERFSEVPNIEVINQDAMEYDYSQLTGPWWILVSNLPYYIGTRLLVKLITEVPVIHRYVVMVQKEVAERITAQPGTKEYGALSVVCSLFATPKHQFDVSKHCFSPVPKITSSVITLQRETLFDEEDRLEAFRLSKIAFQQKRKKVKSALQDFFSVEELEQLGINPDDRPQNLSPEQYLELAKSLN